MIGKEKNEWNIKNSLSLYFRFCPLTYNMCKSSIRMTDNTIRCVDLWLLGAFFRGLKKGDGCSRSLNNIMVKRVAQERRSVQSFDKSKSRAAHHSSKALIEQEWNHRKIILWLLNKHQYFLPCVSPFLECQAVVVSHPSHSFFTMECQSNNSRIHFKIGVVPHGAKKYEGMEFSGFLVKSFGFLP